MVNRCFGNRMTSRIACCAVVLGGAAAQAQEETSARTPRNALTLNAVELSLGLYGVELERAITRASTLFIEPAFISGRYFDPFDPYRFLASAIGGSMRVGIRWFIFRRGPDLFSTVQSLAAGLQMPRGFFVAPWLQLFAAARQVTPAGQDAPEIHLKYGSGLGGETG